MATRKSAIQMAIDELIAKREAVKAEAATRVSALDGSIAELLAQQERQKKPRLKSGPVAVAAGA